ncbi:MAG: ATP-binding protein [Candidatus Aminicenantaceae bacterium]
MTEKDKSKGQPQKELTKLRQRIAELEKLETEHKKAERVAQEAREYTESIVNTVREPLVVLDADLRVISANRSFYQTFKIKPKETEGQLLYNLSNKQWNIPKLRKLLEEILPSNTTIEDYELEHDFETIGKKNMLLNARRIYRETNKTQMILLAIEDTTDRKEMQERLIRSEKLAVLGQLAGGVSHELRNPLGSIKNSAYFLNMALEKPEPEVKETLEILEREIATSERIISSLLDFARTKPSIKRKVNINNIIQDGLIRAKIPKNIKLTRKLDKELPDILVDPDQLRQVFSNIILNAIQALHEGGKLIIKSKTLSPKWAVVSFKDTGSGISKDTMGKLFEPLFTTKAKGIGLGLAVTKTLIEGHGGTIDVESEVGKGSTFTVHLPISPKVEK